MTIDERVREIIESFQELRHATQRHDKKLERFFNTFSHQELHALVYIGRNGPVKMSAIADNLQLSLSSVTGIVDRMVAKKMVSRVPSSEDRRIVQVVLTREATRLYDEAMNRHLSFMKDMLNTLNAQEQDQLLTLVKKIALALKERQDRE